MLTAFRICLTIRQFSYAGNGVVEANSEDGGSSLLYSGEFYNEPDAPHSVVTDDAGNTWYQMSADDIADGVQTPSFNGNAFGFSDMPDDASYSFGGNGIIEASSADGDSVLYNSACFAEPEGSYQTVTDADGNSWYQMSAEAIGDGSISAPSFIGNEFESYNPTFGDISPSSENVSFPVWRKKRYSPRQETVLLWQTRLPTAIHSGITVPSMTNRKHLIQPFNLQTA